MAPSGWRGLAAGVLAAIFVMAVRASPAAAATSPPVGSWLWPIVGPVLRGFEPPPTPYSSGHRGIDIGADFGTPVRAPADGTVTFAGPVGGSLFVTIDHGDGYKSTSSFLSEILVRRGGAVVAGEVVALSGRGHPEIPTPQLHFGVRLDGTYIDPLPLLEPQSVVDLIRLAPLADPADPPEPPAANPVGQEIKAPFGALFSSDRLAAVWWEHALARRTAIRRASAGDSARAPPAAAAP